MSRNNIVSPAPSFCPRSLLLRLLPKLPLRHLRCEQVSYRLAAPLICLVVKDSPPALPSLRRLEHLCPQDFLLGLHTAPDALMTCSPTPVLVPAPPALRGCPGFHPAETAPT